jgi:hypothetical protein
MKRKLTILGCIAACFVVSARAQAPEEYARFREDAGEASVLYRGRLATRYTMVHNGHPYWSTPDFLPGSVVYNEKTYDGVLLNIDARSQQVLVKYAPDYPAVQLPREEVPEFTIGNTRWINPQAMGYTAPEGFFEVLADRGPVLALRRVGKRIKQSPENRNGKFIGYWDPDYNMNAINYFEFREAYYLLQNGKCSKAGRRRVMRYVDGSY